MSTRRSVGVPRRDLKFRRTTQLTISPTIFLTYARRRVYAGSMPRKRMRSKAHTRAVIA